MDNRNAGLLYFRRTEAAFVEYPNMRLEAPPVQSCDDLCCVPLASPVIQRPDEY